MIHLRQHANTNESGGVFIHLIFEAIQGWCKFGGTDHRKRLIEQASRQQCNVAFWLGKNVKMFVVGFQSFQHFFAFMDRLRRQEAEVL